MYCFISCHEIHFLVSIYLSTYLSNAGSLGPRRVFGFVLFFKAVCLVILLRQASVSWVVGLQVCIATLARVLLKWSHINSVNWITLQFRPSWNFKFFYFFSWELPEEFVIMLCAWIRFQWLPEKVKAVCKDSSVQAPWPCSLFYPHQHHFRDLLLCVCFNFHNTIVAEDAL